MRSASANIPEVGMRYTADIGVGVNLQACDGATCLRRGALAGRREGSKTDRCLQLPASGGLLGVRAKQ
eukprot:2392931-Pyramimonas_sp.AAC.1